MSALAELLSISSPALGPDTQADNIRDPALSIAIQDRNGFFALENALWFLADESSLDVPGHNHPEISGWMKKYPRTAGIIHAFAVDAIGYPFVTSNQGILRMDLETGKFVRIGHDLEGWAHRLLKDFSRLTHWQICHDWQDKNGPLPAGHRLFPKLPFAGGGKVEVENLTALPLVELIGFYADLSSELKSLPDGGTIEIQVSE